jgi:enoyl-CoA hydratase
VSDDERAERIPRGEIRSYQLDGASVLEIANPSRRNALSTEMTVELERRVAALGADAGTRVIVLVGADGAFCSGFDLSSADLGADTVMDKTLRQEVFNRIVVTIRRSPVPVVALVAGTAAGAGMALALAADIRIAEAGARFIPSFVRLGLSAEMAVTYLLPRMVGWDHAAEILLTGREVGAHEAQQLGLVWSLAEPGDGMNVVATLVARIAALAPGSTRGTKALLNSSLEATSLEQQVQHEGRTQLLLSTGGDFAEATSAFFEKRPPRFQGT